MCKRTSNIDRWHGVVAGRKKSMLTENGKKIIFSPLFSQYALENGKLYNAPNLKIVLEIRHKWTEISATPSSGLPVWSLHRQKKNDR